jgi:hypothetical protein
MEREKHFFYRNLIAGIFLLIVGVVLLLGNFNILESPPIWKFWPLIVIAMGIGRILDAKYTREYHKAFWMLFMGSWFLVSELHIFGLRYGNSWPILLIGLGIGMLWKSYNPSHRILKDHCNGI